MSQPNLSLSESQELSAMLGNRVLMAAFRKVMVERAEFWHRLGSSEAQKPNPNVTVLVQHAIREATMLNVEEVLKKAAGV